MKPIPIILSLMLMAVPLPGAERVVLCGWDEVYMLDPDAVPPAKTWSWQAQDHPEIAPGLAKAFGTTDECKPVDDGRRLLVSSSGGGCALLELPSGKPVWLARVRNAHSLELLPGGRILAASSVGGDQLVLFDQKTGDKIRWSTAFPSAHGLVWDAGRNLLYALGFQELRTYP